MLRYTAIETTLTTKFTLPGSFQDLDDLGANLRANNCADGHDQSEFQIDIPKGAMLFHRHDRFANNVSEIGPDGVIPIQTDQAQSRPGNETSPNPKKAAKDSDYKSDDDQINGTDVGPRNREKHISQTAVG